MVSDCKETANKYRKIINAVDSALEQARDGTAKGIYDSLDMGITYAQKFDLPTVGFAMGKLAATVEHRMVAGIDDMLARFRDDIDQMRLDSYALCLMRSNGGS